MTQDLLSRKILSKDKELLAELIVDICCRKYKIDPSLISQRTRLREVVEVRRTISYLLIKFGLIESEIASCTGMRRDAIYHYEKSFIDLTTSDKSYKEKNNDIINHIIHISNLLLTINTKDNECRTTESK